MGVLSHERLPPAAFAAVHEPPDALPYDWPNRDSSVFVAVDGTRWHVQRSGKGPRLLLVHGTSGSTHSFRDLLPLLAETHDVLAIDLPGHAYTDRRNDGSMSLPDLAASLSALLSQLSFRPNFAIGHSAGAAIVLRMALDRAIEPATVIGLNAALLPFGGALRGLFAPLAQLFANTRLMPRLVARRARALTQVFSGSSGDSRRPYVPALGASRRHRGIPLKRG